MVSLLVTAVVLLGVFIILETGVSRWLNKEEKPLESRAAEPERRYRSEVQSKH
ncbi:protein-S-isoprenylcysteine O-methyltransferase Ste14 [Peribacillus deserti]|uniref:Protein-S-isoprenylcysteine O-methyltransferase Ste14 n=1 Tax=Peribacillus deserti TaxID=673318 RepID=A0ABS2QJ72_9BACI|nr:hypothetical protein [Peribacillus deserti]MBM7693211.1 protein-S-isoprenylcysteine O-methyltransferase Ste14 [Peribacillus deserti]